MKTAKSRTLFRIVICLTVVAGLQYILWRYFGSLNTDALWFSIPFVIAETYGIIDMILFLLMMWKPKSRTPPAHTEEPTVDVFITTYNEDPYLVEKTAEAACRLAWKHKNVWVLDDGNRPLMKAIAEKSGCGYLVRGSEWDGKPRHAKAGNVNNAILQTTGDFILILDADQIVAPRFLERTMGYFEDPMVAFVQTPQFFYNTLPGDPFGSDAPLFYGPIMQGKDGWNAAFFCGSNAVLRREALMQLGLVTYVREVEKTLHKRIRSIRAELRQHRPDGKERRLIRKKLRAKLAELQKDLHEGKNLGLVSDEVLAAIQEASASLSAQDLHDIAGSLQDLADNGDLSANIAGSLIVRNQGDFASVLANSEAIGVSAKTVGDLDLTRGGEAIPVQALYTKSITEDMATALRLHALGYKSVYHHEILAQGLAPEDLGTSLTQRLRWAQGTIQVFLKENPLTVPGLTLAQRLMYFATIYSYFSGFSNLFLLLGPVIWFFFALAPVAAWNWDFFARFIPFMVLNRLIFMWISKGFRVWRSEQYSLALFPVWIQAVVSVVTKQKVSFVVTPKQRQAGNYLRLVWPQMAIIALTLVGIMYAGWALMTGVGRHTWFGYAVNSFWGLYNALMLTAVIRAAVYQPPQNWNPQPRFDSKEA